jgi:hypothetical protein
MKVNWTAAGVLVFSCDGLDRLTRNRSPDNRPARLYEPERCSCSSSQSEVRHAWARHMIVEKNRAASSGASAIGFGWSINGPAANLAPAARAVGLSPPRHLASAHSHNAWSAGACFGGPDTTRRCPVASEQHHPRLARSVFVRKVGRCVVIPRRAPQRSREPATCREGSSSKLRATANERRRNLPDGNTDGTKIGRSTRQPSRRQTRC